MADLLAFKFCIRTPLPRRACLPYTVRRFGPSALGWARGRAFACSCRHAPPRLRCAIGPHVLPASGLRTVTKRNAPPYIVLNLAPRSSSAIFTRPQSIYPRTKGLSFGAAGCHAPRFMRCPSPSLKRQDHIQGLDQKQCYVVAHSIKLSRVSQPVIRPRIPKLFTAILSVLLQYSYQKRRNA
jgi:hypothetical protein